MGDIFGKKKTGYGVTGFFLYIHLKGAREFRYGVRYPV